MQQIPCKMPNSNNIYVMEIIDDKMRCFIKVINNSVWLRMVLEISFNMRYLNNYRMQESTCDIFNKSYFLTTTMLLEIPYNMRN